jgi:hypothetical protein
VICGYSLEEAAHIPRSARILPGILVIFVITVNTEPTEVKPAPVLPLLPDYLLRKDDAGTLDARRGWEDRRVVFSGEE